mgnify:CR=1 FL=1
MYNTRHTYTLLKFHKVQREAHRTDNKTQTKIQSAPYCHNFSNEMTVLRDSCHDTYMSSQTKIVHWFRRNARDLPWRHPGVSPWNILVSEIMLQQTQASRVAVQWTEWVERWPTVHDVAAAKPADILRMWNRLGYPSRALRLHEAAQIIVRDFHGNVPTDEETLLQLPGVGHYTAAAVCAFAFQHPTVMLDTNVRRVIGRIWSGQARPPLAVSAIEREFAKSLIPKRQPNSWLWAGAVMEFGALVCTATKPACSDCIVRSECTWRLAGYPESTVKPKSKKFAGSDRQVRGRIMKILRESKSSMPRTAFADVCTDKRQRDRALAALIDDGLVEVTKSGRYRLPN